MNMDSPGSNPLEAPAFKPFTKAERIQQLNDIDRVGTLSTHLCDKTDIQQSITNLLQSAGLALKTLSASLSDELQPPPSERREAFEVTCNSYLKTLQAVDIGLHRQIYGLEESAIIPADKAKKTGQDAPSMMPGMPKSATAASEAVGGDSGMGNLDIGFLNSRSGQVGRDMEAELWAKARGFLEKVEGGKNGGETQKEQEDHQIDT